MIDIAPRGDKSNDVSPEHPYKNCLPMTLTDLSGERSMCVKELQFIAKALGMVVRLQKTLVSRCSSATQSVKALWPMVDNNDCEATESSRILWMLEVVGWAVVVVGSTASHRCSVFSRRHPDRNPKPTS